MTQSTTPTPLDLHQALMDLYAAEEAYRAAKISVDAAEKRHDEICAIVYPNAPEQEAKERV